MIGLFSLIPCTPADPSRLQHFLTELAGSDATLSHWVRQIVLSVWNRTHVAPQT